MDTGAASAGLKAALLPGGRSPTTSPTRSRVRLDVSYARRQSPSWLDLTNHQSRTIEWILCPMDRGALLSQKPCSARSARAGPINNQALPVACSPRQDPLNPGLNRPAANPDAKQRLRRRFSPRYGLPLRAAPGRRPGHRPPLGKAGIGGRVTCGPSRNAHPTCPTPAGPGR